MTTRTNGLPAVAGEANAAVIAERIRISSILESPEGRRNVPLAQELALRSSIDVETARSILSKAPSDNPYISAMNREAVIDVGGMAATDLGGDKRAARLKEIEGSMEAFNADRYGKTTKRKG
jgi:hypothetical protein